MMNKPEDRIGAHLDGVGTPLWSGSPDFIPRIDLSEIESLSPGERAKIEEMLNAQTEQMNKGFAAVIEGAKKSDRKADIALGVGVISLMATLAPYLAKLFAWLVRVAGASMGTG